MLGREDPTPLPGGHGVQLRGHVTMVSPPVTVPAGTQILDVTLRAPGGGGLALVSARPEAGGADVPLGTLEPGAAVVTEPLAVPSALVGATVRVVVDPIPALGTALELYGVGPLIAPLPRWSASGAPFELAGTGDRRVLRVREGTLHLAAPSWRPPARTRALLVDVRGDGLLRARAGAAPTTVRAGARWRTVRVRLPARRARLSLALTATAGADGLQLRRIGVAERPPRRRR